MKHVWGVGWVHPSFLWGNLRERFHWEDPGVDERIILRWIIREWDGGMDWIDLAHDRDRWLALVNAVMNFRFP
jgi:hypothetical protein